MKYTEYAPAPPLGDVVNCFWSIEQDPGGAPGAVQDRSVPDGSLELVLHLGDPMLRQPLEGRPERESRSILIGQVTRPYLVVAGASTRMLGVRFFPQTGFLILGGAPAAEFNDRSVELESFLPRAARPPLARIGEAATTAEAIRLLEGWCLERLRTLSPRGSDRCFARACDVILRARGTVDIGTVAASLGIGNRYLERLFIERSGISPKLFARIIRFQQALGSLAHPGRRKLAVVAQDAGYFDQAHFIRDFRRFTGLAPREFLKERHPFTGPFADPANRSHLYNFR
jgi:AraC-like DNA-binding protein